MKNKFNKTVLDSNIKSVHFVGIGGIGMSGIAQFFNWLGFRVSGSDRALDNPENKELFKKLTAQGIALFVQDGSYVDGNKPDLLVYSTAVEEGNPDFIAGEGLPRLHRAEALAYLCKRFKDKTSIAVTGSCGKTSVSAWIAEAFDRLYLDPVVVNGGVINSFNNNEYSGNFKPGNGDYFIFEADESDKSLVAFKPDYSVVLNIGTDHYSKKELIEVFEQFLRNTKKGAVIEDNVIKLLNPRSYKHLDVVVFSGSYKKLQKKVWQLKSYKVKDGIAKAVCIKDEFEIEINLPLFGFHNAANALSILALTYLLKLENSFLDITGALENFNGVHRRLEHIGRTQAGTLVYDDYAHNVEKIASVIQTAHEIVPGNVFAVFQPHGYGPLKFMREELFPALEKVLCKNDKFIFMPVYYAGGTSSFSPKSSEVSEEYALKSEVEGRYLSFDSRKTAGDYLKDKAASSDIILIMGARDGSLSIWAKELVGKLNAELKTLNLEY